MAYLYGKEQSREEICKRTGSLSQFCAMRPGTLEDGKARGMRCIDVKTGGGLSFTILPDRCMDICWAEYNGISLGYLTKSDVCSPAYFLENGSKGFSDSFFGGLLTTSGLSNIGAANVDEGKVYGLHGTISNIPATGVSVNEGWQGDEYHMSASGVVRQSRFNGEDLELRRTIETSLGSQSFLLRDEVRNNGFESQPFMLLYHFNFGYPFVSEDSSLQMNKSVVTPRTEIAAQGMSTYDQMLPPTPQYAEQCFYHDFTTAEDHLVTAALFNPHLGGHGLGVYLRYSNQQLPYFCQWKQTGEQEYVMGLIPATWYAEGRSAARERGELLNLEPMESKVFEMEIGITNQPFAL